MQSRPVHIVGLILSAFIATSCNTIGPKKRSANVKDIADDNDLYWFEVRDIGRYDGPTPLFFRGTCSPGSPKTPKYCQSNLKKLIAEDLSTKVSNQLAEAIGRVPSDDQLVDQATPWRDDPAFEKSRADVESKSGLLETIRKKNEPLIAGAESEYMNAHYKFINVMQSISAYQKIIDTANAAIAGNPGDTDAKNVLNKNIAAQAILKNDSVALAQDDKDKKAVLDKLMSEISDASAAVDAASQSLRSMRSASAEKYKVTVECSTKLAERDKLKKSLQSFQSEIFPQIIARMKRTGLPIEINDLQEEDGNFWRQFVKPLFD